MVLPALTATKFIFAALNPTKKSCQELPAPVPEQRFLAKPCVGAQRNAIYELA